MGVAASWDCGSIFIGGLEVDVGGIGQCFLSLNRFHDIDPALGHGVPAGLSRSRLILLGLNFRFWTQLPL